MTEVRLPTLDRRLRVRMQATALLVAVLALLLTQLVLENRRAARRLGVTLGESTPGLDITAVEPGGPAAWAGLLPRDRVLAVDGKAIADAEGYQVAARTLRPTGKVPFLVERDGRRLVVAVRPGMPLEWRNWVLNALGALAYLALALLALWQRNDLRARLLLFFSLAVAVELALPTAVSPAQRVFITGPLFYLLTGLQMGLELHLASVIPERQTWLQRHRWVVPTYYAVGLAFAALGIVTYAGGGLGIELPWTSRQFDWILNNVALPAWAFVETALLARPALTHPEPQGRHQAALVLAGVFPWAAVVAVRLGHTLAGQGSPAWADAIEPLALLCYPVAVAVAISRFQLFDLELVVRRSLVYTTLTTVLLLVFYAALGAGGVLFSEFVTGGERIWVVAGATLLLGLLFTPLRRSVEHVIYRRFFPERVALRQRLTALAGELPALGKLPLMGNRVVASLGEILGIRWATLLIADPHSGLLMPLSTTVGDLGDGLERSLLLSPADPGLKLLTQSGRAFPARQLAAKSAVLAQRLDALRAQVAVPLVSHGKLIGLLLLGPKPAGDRYLAEEMELLNLLAHHVAIVFENARLFESATRDSLTGLLRREAILERLEAELQRAVRYGRPLAIGLADLDHFKSVNDRFGHLMGDAMLQWVSRVLQSGLRSTDHVGRYGGEEFLLLLPETDLAGAVAVAEKARALVESERFVDEEGKAVAVTLSIGLAAVDELPRERLTAKELIAAADRSLYRAKDEGRNQVRPALVAGGELLA
ncbi:MAG TPA: diguanylate cyclase [Thermoanaerobaculia bacterium]|nr:diguanylate cyclase [Thermoanaerobaculia bacterium]